MPEYYTTAGSYQTVKVLSQTSVVDVEAIGIYTKPSGVYIVVQVPLAAYNQDNYDVYLATTASLVEGVLAAAPDPGQTLVSGVSYVQDIDSSGLLSAFLDFTVSYTPTSGNKGTYSTVVRLPLTSFETAEANNTPVNGKVPLVWLDDAYQRLKALSLS